MRYVERRRYSGRGIWSYTAAANLACRGTSLRARCARSPAAGARGLDAVARGRRRSAQHLARARRGRARRARRRAHRRMSPARLLPAGQPARPRPCRERRRRPDTPRRATSPRARACSPTAGRRPRACRLGAPAVSPHGAAGPAAAGDRLLERVRAELHERRERTANGARQSCRRNLSGERPARRRDGVRVQRVPESLPRGARQQRPHADGLQHLDPVQRPVGTVNQVQVASARSRRCTALPCR